jgi:hypothetical protein
LVEFVIELAFDIPPMYIGGATPQHNPPIADDNVP